MDKMPSHDLILKLLKEKTIVQLNVRNNIQEQFKVMKQVLAELAKEIAKKATELDKRINVQYKELNESEVMLTIAEDVLIFYLQTNITLKQSNLDQDNKGAMFNRKQPK